jgi:hypothetical protein
MKPEILPPAAAPKTGSGHLAPRYPSIWFDDQRLDLLAHWLDDCFKIPGIPFRFGIDAFIGLVPGLGDLLSGLLACILLVAGWMRGLPYITLLRMLANVAIEIGVGAVPFIGDAFDIAWKANRRNFALLQRHIAEPRRHTWRDWGFLLTIAAAIFLVCALPLIVLLALLLWLISHLKLAY